MPAATAAMSTVKIHYFDFIKRGRAYPIRMALKFAGLEHQDCNVSGEEFAKERDRFPFGQLPVVEIDGKTICQQNAIMYAIGAKAGLIPDTPFEIARVLEIMGAVEDVDKKIFSTVFVPDDKKKELRKEMLNTDAAMSFVTMAKRLEKMVASSGTPGYCVGSKITIADLVLYKTIDWVTCGILDGLPTDTISAAKHPRMMQVAKTVEEHPKLKTYIASMKA